MKLDILPVLVPSISVHGPDEARKTPSPHAVCPERPRKSRAAAKRR